MPSKTDDERKVYNHIEQEIIMIEELMEYGLSEKEAQIYLTTLKLGSATANRVTQLVNMPRSTVYEILDKLKSMGLISTLIRENKTNFVAAKPKRLLELLDEKKQSVQKILPDLNKLQAVIEERPFAEVFQGKIAVFKILDEIVDAAKSEIKIIGSMENAVGMIGYRTNRFRTIRKDKGTKVMQILERSEESVKEKLDKYTEVRYLADLKGSKEAIFILEDCVYYILLQHEISAIKIKVKEHANTMRILFRRLWNSSKK